jgi:hypothetical protein
MFRHWNGERIVLFVLLLLSGVRALGCGPVFPNTILGDAEYELLLSPDCHFATELQELYPAGFAGPTRAGLFLRANVTTLQAATNELQSCFLADGQLTPRERSLLDAFGQARKAVADHWDNATVFNDRLRWQGSHDGAQVAPIFPDVTIPDALPFEFGEYFRGAVAWHTGDAATAQLAWESVLEKPESERRYRSTWAAYMLGRSRVESAPQQAVEHFQEVRALAERGFKDALGLARASLGWEAYTELHRNNFGRAANLYTKQYVAGDATAIVSLRVVAAKIMKGDAETLAIAVRDERTRPIVTAYLLSKQSELWRRSEDGVNDICRWMDAIEEAGVRGVAGADRLAWAAYSAGEMGWAKTWATRAPEGSVIASWIQAKLALRDGNTEHAKRLLKTVVAGLSAEDSFPYAKARAKAASELAALHMSSAAYTAALDLLIRNGWRWDGAYVAERVLTTDELLQHVSDRWQEDRGGFNEDGQLPRINYWYSNQMPKATPAWIHYLLARRLARAERFDEALDHYPPRNRARISLYAKSLREGRDGSRPLTERADALWKAATILRHEGMDLFGTEVEPDWLAVGGLFTPEHMSTLRTQARTMKLGAPGEDELMRLKENNETHPTQRHHYRYRAAELGWQAARMMPDNSMATAKVLCQAGSWLKFKDPKAADRFYKALVNRCRKTALGQEADQLRWFPALEKRNP